MKIKTLLVATAFAALSATTVSAGGFKYGTLGGNFGKFATGNVSAFGSAKVSGYGYGQTSNESYGEIKTYKGHYSAGGHGSSGNQSSFKTFGHGTAHSSSGVNISAGVGYGIGGNIGGFKKH